jgi:hypothetical protein
MRITIDTRDPRLSPTERIVLGNVANKLKPPPRTPTPAQAQSVDEALGDG